MANILSWEDLNKMKSQDYDRINGKTNSYASLRLFNNKKSEVELILYRDRHAWCPYCQKIWLWLEFKKVPYIIKKVNMNCYGKKEDWYLQKVPSGKLPAIEFKGEIIKESDHIIYFLEEKFGVLGTSLLSSALEEPRRVERNIFKEWCEWLCRDNFFRDSDIRKKKFIESISKLEGLLSNSKHGFIDPSNEYSDKKPGTGDIIFIPFLERINASLCYYKGFSLRKEFPLTNRWLTLLERESSYLGTQGDFHTHSHDLPPQMGGCFKEKNNDQVHYENLIDNGKGLGKLELNLDYENELSYYSSFALMRVMKHKRNILNINPCEYNLFDIALRTSLTYMVTGELNKVDDKSGIGLRYLRDRISVPRDMPLISARLLRQSLDKIASFCKINNSYKIPIGNRYDQNPINFI